jgi:opacity protein-like surface antigen
VGISADQSSNNFGMAFGGGLDMNANKNIAIRVAKLDYLFNRIKNSDLGVSENLNHLRFSTGVVFKF